MRCSQVTPKIVRRRGKACLPDFEIRYFHADGTLAIVHITACDSRADAEERASALQHDYPRFEVFEITATP
jgi:hypothetical protein